MVMTPLTRTTFVEIRRRPGLATLQHALRVTKVRPVRTFCFPGDATCLTSHCPTVRSAITISRCRWPRSPHRSARVSPRLRSPAKSTASVVDTSFRIDHDARLAIVTDRDAGGTGRDPPFDGASARLCGQGAVSRSAGDDRSGDRERLLLRFFVQAPVHARGPAAIEKRKMHELAKKDEPVTRKEMPRDEAVEYFKASAKHYKAEIIASIPADQDDFALHAKASSSTCAAARTCPRPASSRSSS